METTRTTSHIQDVAYFLSFCIEQYKTDKGITGAEALQQFCQWNVLEYLEAHYEPLHTQSRQWILEEIDEFIKIRKSSES